MKARFRKFVVRMSLVALSLTAFCAICVLFGTFWTVNSDFQSPEEGVPIWIFAGPIHTDIIVPVRGSGVDWTDLVPPGDLATRYLAVGWGDRKFYLETPTWGDLTFSTALGAFLGRHSTAMHVDRIAWSPSEWKYCHQITISNRQYQDLCSYIRHSFALDSQGRVRPISAPGYGAADSFYEAVGRYSAAETCNTWTGQALAHAGVRVGCWTPLPWSVTASIPRAR